MHLGKNMPSYHAIGSRPEKLAKLTFKYKMIFLISWKYGIWLHSRQASLEKFQVHESYASKVIANESSIALCIM